MVNGRSFADNADRPCASDKRAIGPAARARDEGGAPLCSPTGSPYNYLPTAAES